MNELIARALAARFAPLVQGKLLTTVTGLVKTFETDQFTKHGKDIDTMPVPYQLDSRTKEDWKILLPDSPKTGIVYFEDGGYSTPRRIGGIDQVQARLTLVCWFNGNLVMGANREKMTNILLHNLCPNNRTIKTMEPGFSALQLAGYSQSPTDPFTKYSAYSKLFEFKSSPYGWLTLDLTLRAYVNAGCLI